MKNVLFIIVDSEAFQRFGNSAAGRSTSKYGNQREPVSRIILLGIPKVDVFEEDHHLVCLNANSNNEDAQ